MSPALPLFVALQAAKPIPSEEEIVVLAQKMRLIEVDIKAPKRGGKLVLQRCRVTRPSGRAELDAVPCDTAQACMLDAPATRKQLSQCVEEKSQLRLDAIVAAWKARS